MNKKRCICCRGKLRHDYKKFCSLKCRTNSSFKEIKCDLCSKIFKKRKYQIKRTKHNFCSKKCSCLFFYKKANDIISKQRLGKSYENIYGREKALKLRKKLTKVHIGLQNGENHPLFLKQIDNNKIIELYKQFKSIKYIARKFKCSPSVISNRLKRLGIKIFNLEEIPIRDETRRRQSETRKRLYKENKVHTPIKDTTIEVKIQNFLKQLKIEFYVHQYMHIIHGYQCDIFIPSIKTIIECDGDYWHGDPLRFPNPNNWQKEQIEKDRCRTEELISSGFKVIRLWEREIKVMSLNKFREQLNVA